MSKKNIDSLIVVEGASDVGFLSSYFNAYFFVTNGYDLSKEKLDFLTEASKVRKVIILTDDDKAGEEIKNKIKSRIDGVFDVKIPANCRKNYKKKGIAESEITPIFEALKPYETKKEILRNNYQLSLKFLKAQNNKNLKEILMQKYRLILGNNKSLENQLNILKISVEDIAKFFEENYDN